VTAAQDEARVDTRDMLVVHGALRREFRLASGVVRQCPEGDLERARLVADHLRLILRFVHRHHTGEDLLLWPKLLDRVPDKVAPVVHLMEEQHARVQGLTDQATERLTVWERTADFSDRDGVAETFDALYATLVRHLAAEEEQILPLVETALTPAEYAQLGEEGMRVWRRSTFPCCWVRSCTRETPKSSSKCCRTHRWCPAG